VQNWIPAKLNGTYILAKCPFRILFCSITLGKLHNHFQIDRIIIPIPEEHSSCVDQMRRWAASHPSLNIIVETYDLPLASLRSGTSFPKLTNEVDLVVVAHLSEVLHPTHLHTSHCLCDEIINMIVCVVVPCRVDCS
jgi:hypothetical protein